VATDLRRGGRFHSSYFRNSSANTAAIKELFKSVHIRRRYHCNNKCGAVLLRITVYFSLPDVADDLSHRSLYDDFHLTASVASAAVDSPGTALEVTHDSNHLLIRHCTKQPYTHAEY